MGTLYSLSHSNATRIRQVTMTEATTWPVPPCNANVGAIGIVLSHNSSNLGQMRVPAKFSYFILAIAQGTFGNMHVQGLSFINSEGYYTVNNEYTTIRNLPEVPALQDKGYFWSVLQRLSLDLHSLAIGNQLDWIPESHLCESTHLSSHWHQSSFHPVHISRFVHAQLCLWWHCHNCICSKQHHWVFLISAACNFFQHGLCGWYFDPIRNILNPLHILPRHDCALVGAWFQCSVCSWIPLQLGIHPPSYSAQYSSCHKYT